MLRGVLRKKIRSDLFDNLGRTIQVVLIIAIGAIAVGSIAGATELIEQDITTNWKLSSPASIGLSLGSEGISQRLVETIEKFPEIDQVEAQFSERIKWRRSPADPWEPATLRAREDYDEMKLYTLILLEGDWPRNKVITVNRNYNLQSGDRVYVEINGKERLVEIGGVTWQMYAEPSKMGGTPIFFSAKEFFTDVTGAKGYKYLTASVPGEYTEAKAKAAAMRIEDKLDGEDVAVYPGAANNSKIVFPGKHPAQDSINGVFFILQVMAFAALILGLFLVYNTITAVVSQQVPQIGVLKAIGATRGQILGLYYTTVFLYGLMAVILAIPLGALGAHGLRIWIVDIIDMDAGQFGLSFQAIMVQVAICILSPLLAATLPIFRGAGITVREAISSYGLTGGGGLLDRLMAFLTFLPRMTSMAVSNTFRKKMRVFMTQITLVVAGMLFIAVMSTQTSVRHTFGPVLFDTIRSNIILGFEDEERFKAIENMTQRAAPPGSEIEMWARVGGEIRPAGQPESFDDRSVAIVGMPVPSVVYGPRLRGGRWLLPDDTYALVMHQKEAAKIGVGVGDWVTLDIPLKRETDWHVVGLLNDPVDDRRIIAPRETLLIAQREVGRGNGLYVRTKNTSPAQDVMVATRLRQNFDRQGYSLTASSTDTLLLLSEDIISRFNILIYLLLIMAIVIAVIGGISLSGILSINVLERRVEIGILRSIGASNAAIGTLFITEGIILGWLSWLIAVPLSMPFSTALNSAVGSAVNVELVFDYAVTSVWIWLGIVTILGIVASWFPSRGAIRVSVRESLSYE